jgi:uncharacterized protein HemX
MHPRDTQDQSTFVAETPLMESASTPVATSSTAATTPPTTTSTGQVAVDTGPVRKKPLNLKLLLISLPIGLVVILFIAVQIRNSQGEQLPLAATPTPAVVQNPQVDRSPIQQRLDRLRAELQIAAPTQQEFAFPPIDSTITIDSR